MNSARSVVKATFLFCRVLIALRNSFSALQRKKHHFFSRHNVKTLRFKLTVLSVVLTYEILGIFLGCTYVSGEDVVDTSIRLAIILGTIGFTGTLVLEILLKKNTKFSNFDCDSSM